MKYSVYAILLILAGLSVSCSPSKAVTDTGTTPEAVVVPLENALLWKISHADLAEDSYLFGTIHMIDAQDFFLPAGTEEAFSASQKVVFEVDLDMMNDIGSQIGLLTKAFMQNGTSLRDLLDDEEYGIVQDHFEEMGLPLFLFERLKPMFLATFASGDFSFEDISAGTMKSYEMEFYEDAQMRNLPVEGLETLEFQMSIFDSIPYEDQAQMLMDAIRNQDSGSEAFQQMIDLYKAQNVEALYALINGESEDIAEHEDILISGRNRYWIGVMESMMAEGSVFFAVGAGHLGGREGVIRLLRNAGYEVVPLSEGQVRHPAPKKELKRL